MFLSVWPLLILQFFHPLSKVRIPSHFNKDSKLLTTSLHTYTFLGTSFWDEPHFLHISRVQYCTSSFNFSDDDWGRVGIHISLILTVNLFLFYNNIWNHITKTFWTYNIFLHAACYQWHQQIFATYKEKGGCYSSTIEGKLMKQVWKK